MIEVTGLIVGSIYQDGARERMTPPPVTDLRKRLLARLEIAKSAAFDSDHERAMTALMDVMRRHEPWQRWEQVFRPLYIGDKYRGIGCRSCDWQSAHDCPTVEAIAAAFGMSAN